MTDVGEKPHDSLRIEKPSAHCQLAPLCAETRIHWEWIDRRVRKSASIANGSVRAVGKSGSIANGTPKPEPDPRSSWNGTGSPDRNSESIANGSPNPSWISPSIANGSQNPSPVADPFPMEAPNRTGHAWGPATLRDFFRPAGGPKKALRSPPGFWSGVGFLVEIRTPAVRRPTA